MARDSEVNADELGNGASAVFVVRPGGISTDKGENWNCVGLEKKELMDCREHKKFTTWRNQVYTGMLIVIRLKNHNTKNFFVTLYFFNRNTHAHAADPSLA